MNNWRVLPRNSHPSTFPLLLLSFAVHELSYTASVTDLKHLWISTLSKRSIARQALSSDNNFPIDVLAGDAQMAKLLHYLSAATSLETGTTLAVKGTPDQSDLHIGLTASLPKPLGLLEWDMDLCRAGPEVLRDMLLLPAIRAVGQERKATEDLLGVVAEKDMLVTKMYDRVETSGVDLGAAFPGLVPRGARLGSREALQRYVPSLKKFDVEEWRSGLGVEVVDADTGMREACEQIFAHSSHEASEQSGEKEKGRLKLDASVVLDSQPMEVTKSKVSGSSKAPRKASEDDETETESEPEGLEPVIPNEDRQSPEVSPPPAVSQPTPSKKKLGSLGAKKETMQPLIEKQNAEKNVSSQNGERQSTPPVIESPKPKGKLGRLGGRNLKTQTNDSTLAESGSGANLPSRGKDSPLGNERPSRRDAPNHTQEQHRETSLERADRNRAELKREMEAKRNAPAKKKRKF